jgi:hypothetical protein
MVTVLYDTVIMDSGHHYTIAELADAAAAALDALGIAARNGQVRERPDTRTIRYYSGLGLVDRPTEMSGRTAYYGDRHLLQVLAVKALQARGATLAEVQRVLVGASEAELRRAVGPDLPAALAATAQPGGDDARRPGDQAFWRTPPAPAPAPARAEPSGPPSAPPAPGAAAEIADAGAAAPDDGPLTLYSGAAQAGPEPAPAEPASPRSHVEMRPRPLVAVPLAAGVTLLIEHAGPGGIDTLDSLDIQALRTAAAPLLAYLTRAGLLPGLPNNEGTTP